MGREEINEAIGLTEPEMDAIGLEYERDQWDAEEFVPIPRGRPLMFGEEMTMLSFRVPVSVARDVEERAEASGLAKSEYLRRIVGEAVARTEV